MSIALFYPGDVVGPLVLNDILREIHDEQRIVVIADLARRKANGAPNDGVVDPGLFIPREDRAGLKVTVKTIPASQMRLLDARHVAALQRYEAAAETKIDGEDEVERDGRIAGYANAIYAAKGAYVAAIVSRIDGFAGGAAVVAGDDGLAKRDIDALDDARLIPPLWSVAVRVQRLTAKKAVRSGLSAA